MNTGVRCAFVVIPKALMGTTKAGAKQSLHALLVKACKKAKLKVYGGANAPYVWVRCPEGVTRWQMFDKMLNEANVVITPGAGFGSAGEGCFRISAFNSRANVKEVFRRMPELK